MVNLYLLWRCRKTVWRCRNNQSFDKRI